MKLHERHVEINQKYNHNKIPTKSNQIYTNLLNLKSNQILSNFIESLIKPEPLLSPSSLPHFEVLISDECGN